MKIQNREVLSVTRPGTPIKNWNNQGLFILGNLRQERSRSELLLGSKLIFEQKIDPIRALAWTRVIK